MNVKLLVFFGIVALGVLISTISLTKCKSGGDRTIEPPLAGGNSKVDATIPSTSGNGTSGTLTDIPKTKLSGTGSGSNETQAQPPKFKTTETNSPESEVAAIANLAANNDYTGLLAKIGPQIPERERARIKALIENPELEIDPARPFWEVAKSSKDNYRWMLNFVPKKGSDAEAKSIQIDLTKSDKGQHEVTKVVTPATVKEIANLVSRKPKARSSDDPTNLNQIRPVDSIEGQPTEEPGDTELQVSEVDPLTVAQAFSLAVLNEDFISARQLAGDGVTDERIAGLMIALEDGDFSLREDRPLVVAFGNDTKSMVLSRVYSPKQNSEFAITLGKRSTWYVKEITFGKVIASLAKDADATYSPIVEDPTGGDSLVVYFEFDNSGLTSRADNQLRIVARILQQDRNRRIRITGHADSLGTDDYNSGLSQKRAAAIRNAIIVRGANPEQVITEGYGESKPRKPNFNEDGSDNPQGRSLNRRAEVYLDF